MDGGRTIRTRNLRETSMLIVGNTLDVVRLSRDAVKRFRLPGASEVFDSMVNRQSVR